MAYWTLYGRYAISNRNRIFFYEMETPLCVKNYHIGSEKNQYLRRNTHPEPNPEPEPGQSLI